MWLCVLHIWELQEVATKTCITPTQLEHALALKDLTLWSSNSHAVHLMASEVLEGLRERGWPTAEVVTGPRVVHARENYALLGYSPDEVTLGSEHTRWVDQERLLRTQTTSQIPAALQAAATARKPGEMRLIAAPGITFRRDTRDRWHCAEPHQMDVWVLGEPALSNRKDLLRLVRDILEAATPSLGWVFSDSPHHYTDEGIEVNLLADEKAIEVLECGCIARSLLERLGIDPEQHGGLALGMGLDRLTMLRKGLPDIRLLRDAHPRVQAQMHDLSQWRPVSRLPSTSRDISLAVSPGLSEEALTEKMLNAAGEHACWIEEMQIKGRWAYGDLPEQAIQRLGLIPGQENVLLHIVLRDASRSITTEEANQLYGVIQSAMHEGEPGGGYRL